MFAGSTGDGEGYRQEVGGMTEKSVAEDFEISEERAKGLLLDLEEKGVLRYDHDGVWRLGSSVKATTFLVKNRKYL